MVETHQLIIVPGGPIQLIAAADLRIPAYQPQHRAADIQPMVDHFNPQALGILDVSFREEIYYLIDGQRRWTAAKEVGYREPLLCHVRYGLDEAKESALWGSLNDRKPQHIVDVYRTMVRAKFPRVAVEIDRTLSTYGFMVDYQYGPTTISGVRTLEYLNAWGSLAPAMSIIRGAWQGDGNATMPNVLMALGAFDFVYRQTFYSERFLVDALRDESPRKLVQDAIAKRRDTRGDDKIGSSLWATLAWKFCNLYNKEVADRSLRLAPFKQPPPPYEALVIAKRNPGKSLMKRV